MKTWISTCINSSMSCRCVDNMFFIVFISALMGRHWTGCNKIACVDHVGGDNPDCYLPSLFLQAGCCWVRWWITSTPCWRNGFPVCWTPTCTAEVKLCWRSGRSTALRTGRSGKWFSSRTFLPVLTTVHQSRWKSQPVFSVCAKFLFPYPWRFGTKYIVVSFFKCSEAPLLDFSVYIVFDYLTSFIYQIICWWTRRTPVSHFPSLRSLLTWCWVTSLQEQCWTARSWKWTCLKRTDWVR